MNVGDSWPEQTALLLGAAGLLLSGAWVVFRRVVVADYRNRGRLSWWASGLQFAVFAAFFCFPYLYMPREWAWDWLPNGTARRAVALAMVAVGMVVAFGTMSWFGLRRAFGLTVSGVVQGGPYRFSRNPQMLGGWLMVLGVIVYRPSVYALVWLAIWVVIGHWMVTAEEHHLRQVFGEEYEHYCRATPRYLRR